MTAQDELISWLSENTYEPRGSEHLEVFFDAFQNDLVTKSEKVAEAGRTGDLVYARNHSLGQPGFLGGVDLVIGPPAANSRQQQLEQTGSTIGEGAVGDVWLAVDFETLMSHIRRNWVNRGQSIHSFYAGVFNHSPIALTAGIILINIDDLDGSPHEIFDSYLEFDFAEGGMEKTLDALAVLPIIQGPDGEYRDYPGIEAMLSYDHLLDVVTDGLDERIRGNLDISPDTLTLLSSYGEGEQLEFKSQLPSTVDEIAKDAVAMANKSGGRIILGIDDESNEIVGLEEPKSVEERIANHLVDNINPNVVSQIHLDQVEGKSIISIEILRMTDVPANFKGTFYSRSGTTRRWLNGNEIRDRFPRD